MHRFAVILAVAIGAASTAHASTWADGMFDGLSRDFGTVPRGPVVSHPFRVVNNTGSPVRIAGLRVSCGCVTARALTNYLAPGQETAIIAEMDTRRFVNSRTVTIFVTFDQPSWTEVRLWVRANSREDVNVAPESLSFGRIKRGASASQSVTNTLMGNAQHRILNIACDSNYVQPVCKMTKMNAYEVTYQLEAKLRPDTPPGRWYTDLWVTTNNPAMPKVRIPLTVEIESTLSVNPGLVLFGQVKAGSEETRKIIIRGVEPFRITRVEGMDQQLRAQDTASQKRSVHILTLTLRPQATGQFSRTLNIQTDLTGDSSIDFTTRAYVVP